MKKAYVKVKPKSAKSILGRPYIVATILGAAVCAIALSFVLKPYQMAEEEIKIDATDLNDVATQVIEQKEVYIEEPQTTKIEVPEKVDEKVQEEVEDAGIFEKVSKNSFLYPVEGEITNAYSGGKPVKSKTTGDWVAHNGIDIKAPRGTQVKATCGGKVVLAENNKLTGYTITIDHGDGVVSTVYNLEKIDVKTGQEVKTGDIIGTAGSSAAIEMAEEPHIHFEIKENGKIVNPDEFLK